MFKVGVYISSLFLILTLFWLQPAKAAWPDSGGLIVDHTAVVQFEQIPDYWIEQVKQNITFHYAHTSHGSQIICGLRELEQDYPKYSIAIRENASSAALPSLENPPALRIYDGNPPEIYITSVDYWNSEDGKNRTRAVADTGLFDFSMWSWCGQLSNAWTDVDTYLEVLDQFESEYPHMNFIYMTGHLDGTGSGGTLHGHNEKIRDYSRVNNKVLFDFADIERHDPNGHDYLDEGETDECNWCFDWCSSHPNCLSWDPDSCCRYIETDDEWIGCSHSHRFNCYQKAKAFWWMMARLAGWNPGGTIPIPTATPNPISNIFKVLVNWGNQGGEGNFNDDGRINGLDFGWVIR